MNAEQRAKLIEDLLNGDLSEADFLRLEAEFSVDPEARRAYYERLQLTIDLESLAEAQGDVRVVSLSDRVRPWTRSRGFAALTGGLAAAVVIGLMLIPRPGAQTMPALAESTEQRAQGFGVLSGHVDARWANALTLSKGALIPTGTMQLQAGVAQVELFSGVTLVVEAPAAFEVVSAMEMHVDHGRVRARVPEPAHGFRVLTREGELIDLGTEFALNVSDGQSEVHVLDGEIEWLANQATEKRRLTKGQAVRQNASDPVDLVADASAFLGSVELRQRLASTRGDRFQSWTHVAERQRQDARLVAYYCTASEGSWDRRLPNLAAQGTAGEGAVVAAVQSTDRWGRVHQALDFSPTGSRVRVTVPGEFRSLTFLTWVRIHSLDRWYNSLFLTDGHEQHEPHWQIMDDGRLFFSVKKNDVWDPNKGEKDKHIYYSPPFWTPALSGQWLMLVTTYDVEARNVTHYLNGKPLSEEPIPEAYLVEQVRIGNASLANWSLPENDDPHFAVRNLNGSMDTFQLYRAALSSDEIQQLYENGKP